MERPSSTNMKEEILGAAIRLFTRKGYVNTSMDDIAEAVGLTKGGTTRATSRSSSPKSTSFPKTP